MKVVLIIPAYNEEAILEKNIRKTMRQALKKLNSKFGSGFAWTILSIRGKGILRENRKVCP